MGMYNQVFKNCPDCGCQCELQIRQVVLGFGGFFLDNPSALADFTMEELTEVKEQVKDKLFYCEECGNNFPAVGKKQEPDLEAIKELFGI